MKHLLTKTLDGGIWKIPLLLLCLAFGSQALAQTVTGKVTNSTTGEALIGATVVEEGTTNGTTTDIDGNYRLNVRNANATIMVSITGYQTMSEAVNGRTTVDFALAEGVNLNEVTVTALGIKREKKALGYSAQNLDGENLAVARETNVANSLSGKVAGLQVSRVPGGLGASSRIVIRGNNSLGRNNQPLIVVDGAPINNFQTNSAVEWGGFDRGSGIGDINPDDIASITVLKGPEATALYGVQGGNGAIIVSTRSGSARKGIGVQVNSNYTFDNALFLPDLQSQYAQGSGGVFDIKSGGAWGPQINGQQVEDWRTAGAQTALSSYGGRFDNFLQTGGTFSNSISLSGGSDKTSFYASYTNVNAKGILPTNTLDRHAASLRVGHKMNSWITFDSKISYIHNKGFNRPRLSGDPENAYGSVLYLPPNVNVVDLDPGYDEQRRLRIWNPGGSNVIQNPYWTLQLNTTQDIRDRFMTLGSVNFQFTQWLSLMVRHSMDYYSDQDESRLAYGQRYGEPTGNYSQNRTNSRTSNADFLLSAYKRFGKFGAKVSLGGSRFDVNSSSINGANNGNLVIDFYNLGSGLNDRRTLGNNIWRKRINSTYVLGSFDYNNWLYVEGSYRTDWSSTLPKDNRRFSYPSVSASVILSEVFPGIAGAVPFLKLRGAIAQAGNDVDPYELAPTYGIGSGAGAIVSSVPTRIFNPNLEPEIIKSKELGLEARFLDNRVGIEFSLYKKNATNQRIFLPVPPGSGFSDKIINGGDIQNAGIEVVLNVTPVKASNFRWDIGFNFAKNRNKIIELHPDAKRYLLSGPRAVFIVADEGELFGDIYGRGLQRDSVSGKVIVDADGLPLLTDSKTRFLGNVQPKWIGGINNAFAYKNLSLSFLIDIRQGGVIYSETMSQLAAAGLDPATLANRDGGLVVDGVTLTGEANTKAVNSQQYWERVAGPNNAAEPFVYDASNVMLRELILSYRLPGSILGRSFIKGLEVSLVGRNLFLISKNADTPSFILDAPFSSGNDTGMESGSLPYTRSFGVNLRLNL
jgi:TonB-linked SusC/RagA family outer membrane protein